MERKVRSLEWFKKNAYKTKNTYFGDVFYKDESLSSHYFVENMFHLCGHNILLEDQRFVFEEWMLEPVENIAQLKEMTKSQLFDYIKDKFTDNQLKYSNLSDEEVNDILTTFKKDQIDEIESVIGKKDDNGKTDWSLLPMSTLEGVVKVLMFGEKKYSRDSWQKVDNAKNRYFSALMRHLVKWLDGEKIDSESGLEHIDHALCCLIFLRWFEKDK